MSAFLQSARVRASRLYRWIFIDPIAAWIFVVGSIAPVFATWYLPLDQAVRIKIGGLVVTAFGGAVVWRSVQVTRSAFGQAGLQQRISAWLKRLGPIFGKQHHVMFGAGAAAGSATAHAELSVRYAADERTWLLSRVDALEKNFAELDKRVNRTVAELRTEVRDVRATIAQERAAVDQGISALGKRVETAVATGLDWVLVGAGWVIVGQALSSFPDLVGNLLHHLLG